MSGLTQPTYIGAANTREIVDELDELVRSAFSRATTGQILNDPVLRFRIFPLLLVAFGEYAPGNDDDYVRVELSNYIGVQACSSVEQKGRDIASLINSRLNLAPTYTAASYWSPIDQRRHTVTRRPRPLSDIQQKHVLAYAYAFYALTLTGVRHGLYSVVHYTAENAPRMRGVSVSYQEERGGSLPSWWYIPPGVHQSILSLTGATAAIHRVVLRGGQRTATELEELVRGTLENREAAGWVDVEGFAQDFILAFEARRLAFPAPVRDVIQHTQRCLGELFGTDAIDERQALFMLLTHLLYREACPAEFIYTYPVRVARTCCVMTIGTTERLSCEVDLVLNHFVRSLFTPPLLLDYAAREASARLEAERNALWETTALEAAHQIGTPVSNIKGMLDILRTHLDRNERDKVDLWLEKLAAEARHANDLIYDFKRLANVHNLKRVELSAKSFLDRVVSAIQERGVPCDSVIEIDCTVLADAGRLAECFEELYKNSIRWCPVNTRRIAISAYLAAREDLPAKLDRSKTYTEIHFIDNGPGIASERHEQIFAEFVSTHPKGTGLGLPYIRRLIEGHDGAIESGPHKNGADFVIWLPIVPVSTSAASLAVG